MHCLQLVLPVWGLYVPWTQRSPSKRQHYAIVQPHLTQEKQTLPPSDKEICPQLSSIFMSFAVGFCLWLFQVSRIVPPSCLHSPLCCYEVVYRSSLLSFQVCGASMSTHCLNPSWMLSGVQRRHWWTTAFTQNSLLPKRRGRFGQTLPPHLFCVL